MDQYVRELKNSGANGTDTIPAVVMKDAYCIWFREILHATNLSLCTGIFPNCLKTTKILPSVKKDKDPSQPSSYRPIFSLNMLAKLIERAGFDQLQQHCDKYNLICKEQHGGRSKHSTTTNLLEVQETIQRAKDQGLKSACMGIDLSAAYDLCSHQVLDQQCRLIGACFLTRKFIGSFLGSRKQICEVEGVRSTTLLSLNMGLCQGGRSSGLLFAIHTNLLPDSATTNNSTTKNSKKWENKNQHQSVR